MLTLFKKFLHAFLYDEMAAKRWVRGGFNFAATIGVQLVADPTWSTWTLKQWLLHSVPAVLSFTAGAVTAGDKTPQAVKAAAADLESGKLALTPTEPYKVG